jgi:hypothetical protein
MTVHRRPQSYLCRHMSRLKVSDHGLFEGTIMSFFLERLMKIIQDLSEYNQCPS